MTNYKDSSIAVTGASGHLGRLVLDKLLAAGATKIVAISRAPAKLEDYRARGVELRAGDFNDPASLATAFAGVDRLLLISTDAVDGVGTRTRQQTDAVDAAIKAGVKFIAYTSLTSPYPDPTNPIADSHFWTETRIAAGPTDWALLRNNQYTDYLVPGAQHALATGTLFHAAGQGRRAFITRDDCAAAAVGALLSAEGRRVFDIGGDEAVSEDDIASILSEIGGKTVTAQPLDAASYMSGLTSGGVPDAMAGVLARFDTDAGKGYLAITSGHVQELTGTAPVSVRSYLQQALKA